MFSVGVVPPSWWATLYCRRASIRGMAKLIASNSRRSCHGRFPFCSMSAIFRSRNSPRRMNWARACLAVIPPSATRFPFYPLGLAKSCLQYAAHDPLGHGFISHLVQVQLVIGELARLHVAVQHRLEGVGKLHHLQRERLPFLVTQGDFLP